MTNGSTQLPLVGLMGDNPLAFLASVGTLRTLSRVWPDRRVRMVWKATSAWQPVLEVPGECGEAEVMDALLGALARRIMVAEDLTIKPDLPVTRERYIRVARYAVRRALGTVGNIDRRLADFCAAYGSEAYLERDVIRDTAFRTMSGTGHQHFRGFMRKLLSRMTVKEHLRRALFELWTYSDPRPSMRWDPQDDRRYALRAINPADRNQSPIQTVRGANRLAIEALPCFPTAPASGELRTRGFYRSGSRVTFCWPIWETPITIECLQSLLGHAEIIEERPQQEVLRPLGVIEVFHSRRLTVGRFRNFATGVPCWGRLPVQSVPSAML